MSYRVVNVKTGETMGDFNGVDQFGLAMMLADDLARQKNYKEQFAVIQSITVYETAIDKGGKMPSS